MSRQLPAPRWGWIASQIELAFGVTPAAAQALLASEDGQAKFQALLTRPDAPARLFVYYQSRDARSPDGERLPGGGPPVLFATLGHEDRLRSKALYFVRNTGPATGGGTTSTSGPSTVATTTVGAGRPAGAASGTAASSAAAGVVDVNAASGSDLLAGEIEPALLEGLRATLQDLFLPAFTRREGNEWGKASADASTSFKAEVATFTHAVDGTLSELGDRVELAKPDASTFNFEAAAADLVHPGRLAPELVRHCEGLLESWSDAIEALVKQAPSRSFGSIAINGAGGASTPVIDARSPATAGRASAAVATPQRNSASPAGTSPAAAAAASPAGTPQQSAALTAALAALAEAVPHTEGPRGIIAFWRSRMQRLTSIVEQLKHPHCRVAVAVLTTLVARAAPEDGGRAAASAARAATGGLAATRAAAAATSSTPGAAGSLAGAGPGASGPVALVRRWKAVDASLTESYNEAKDNVKYLSTLARFIDPLLTVGPKAAIDALPGLMNAVKMVHTVARYYNGDDRMTDLFIKITHTLIEGAKAHILATPLAGSFGGGEASEPDRASARTLWNRDIGSLIARCGDALRLNEAYREDFRLMKESVAATPGARRMEGLNEDAIFGRMDLFCRRVVKLIDTFATLAQFEALASHHLDGLDPLLSAFRRLMDDFERRRHDLLQYADAAFDRDYVELNVRIGELELQLQGFLNGAFAAAPSVEAALALLSKCQCVLQREGMREDLEGKMVLILAAYEAEIENAQAQYEAHKTNPPIPRNMPPVAGCITWARNLLRRIDGPMDVFRGHSAVLQTREGRRMVKTYNRVARVLMAFEYQWYAAWVASIDAAKEGLQATLIIRHPDDNCLYVNFDADILQLIREAKWLERLGLEVPEAARVVMLQEAKFKRHHADLSHALSEYSRITKAIIPVTAPLLAPALADIEYRLRPGMLTLTWTSINIDMYRSSVLAGLARLDELVRNVNDIVANRIESNLRFVSRAMLVDLPTDKSTCSLDRFVAMQETAVNRLTVQLQGKNVEVETAVNDLVTIMGSYPVDRHIMSVKPDAIQRLKMHYQSFFYTALLNAVKASLNALKKRVSNVSVSKLTAAAAQGRTLTSADGSRARGGGFYTRSFSGSPRATGGAVITSSSQRVTIAVPTPIGCPAPSTSMFDTSAFDGADGTSGGRVSSSPFFEVEVRLQGGGSGVRLSPSIDDVQHSINRCAKAVLGVSRGIYRWGQGAKAAAATMHAGIDSADASASIDDSGDDATSADEADSTPSVGAATFFDAVTRDMEIVRVVLLLTGSLQSLRQRASTYCRAFEAFSWLWSEDPDAAYVAFQKGSPSLDDYERQLRMMGDVEDAIGGIPDASALGALALSTVNLKAQLAASAGDWKRKYADNLHRAARAAMGDLTEYIKSRMAALARPVDSLDALRFAMSTLAAIRAKEASIENDVTPIMEMYALLEHHLHPASSASAAQGSSGHGVSGAAATGSSKTGSGIGISKEEMDQKSVLRSSWRKLLDRSVEVATHIASCQAAFKKRLLSDVRAFSAEIAAFRVDYAANGPMVDGLPPNEALERLRRYQDDFELRQRKRELYNGGEALFALHQTPFSELDEMGRELQLLDKLYSLYRDVMTRMEEWQSLLWSETVAHIDEMAKETNSFAARCKSLPKRVRHWPAFQALYKRIDDFSAVLPLLQELSKPSLRDRHWEAIATVTSTPLPVNDSGFTLAQLLTAPLVQHHDVIEEECDTADKQQAIELKLAELQQQWSTERFAFAEWKARGVPVLQGVLAVVEELEEAQMQLQTVLASRAIAPFKEPAAELLKTLSDTSDILELWLKVQLQWASLESVFLGGDIARQMPRVATRFQKVDKEWARLMHSAQERGFVVECCGSEVLRQALPVMFVELEACQKSLEGYLENKRAAFPRFYFVSNQMLLQILSQGSDPQAVQQYYEKVFDSISCVEHGDRRDKSLITALISREGTSDERIALRRPVKAVGNIEEWLGSLLKEMRRSMKEACSAAASEILSISAATASAATGAAGSAATTSSAGLEHLRAFVDGHCGQYALLGLQVMWTADVQAALDASRTRKNAMRDASDRSASVLAAISSWCLQDLGSRMNRTKIETLVTIQVHQRDVAGDLLQLYKAKKLSGSDDFEWSKQCRFYWQADGSDSVSSDGACRISITDVDFGYQYEYLGCKERLVITPLTDRCYITLAQAMSMHYGGAPAGPAGTGKTESVKDLGRSLGIYVVVTNCGSEMRYTDCAKIFKGLAQSGAWGCFDEFNRIELEVLSVVAQQVLAVQNAKKSNAPSFLFPGETLPTTLDPVAGFFITMNPGYAGRQELPENLKALFRGVAMMVPDREIIMKVKLCSVGYSNYAQLARKFFVCYQLAEEQLSKQKHYDFGLRNILSVLRTAGATKREHADENEEVLLYRTVRDMNLSKLVAQDVPLFLATLADMFPSVAPPPKATYADLEKAIAEAIVAAGLIAHPSWANKVVQLHEAMLVRHGIMLSGAAGGGKTRIMEVLQAALTKVTGVQHKIVRLNPKAVTPQELFGQTDPLSGEWETGVFAATWAKYNNRTLPYNTWITADGPVDTLWIESLNTVLDDNKLLTLASGDRIPMTENVKILFENETLINASPATVSRAGIVYVSDVDLDWAPVLQAWLRTRPAEQATVLTTLFKQHVGSCATDGPGHLFEFIARSTDSASVLPVTRVGSISAACSLLQTLLDSCEAILSAQLTAARSSMKAGGKGPFGGPDGLWTPPAGAAARAAAAASAAAQAVAQAAADVDSLLTSPYARAVERLVLYALSWSVGGLLEPDDRVKWDSYLRGRCPAAMPPAGSSSTGEDVDTIFEWYPDTSSSAAAATPLPWKRWAAPAWTYPAGDTLDFASLLVPTVDSTRALHIISCLHGHGKPVLVVGGPGTAKTTTVQMHLSTLSPATYTVKRINFSSATTPGIFQGAIESELDKRGGKSFGPAGGKRMTVFIDDVSMPAINTWGDQPTNELVRQLIESGGFYFLDKDKRGDFKVVEDLQYVAAMQQPVGGRNDIPNRLKRHFFAFNLVLPSMASIDELYGQMLRGRFTAAEFSPQCRQAAAGLTAATIDLWRLTKTRMLPTPAKFHYIFSMRELSRVFQGVVSTPKDTIKTGGARVPSTNDATNLLALWRHECQRVFADKLVSNADKAWFSTTLDCVVSTRYGAVTAPVLAAPEPLFVDFLRDDVYDEEDVLVAHAPKVYENAGTMDAVRAKAQTLMAKHNDAFPTKKLDLVLFDDALRHLTRITRLLGTSRGSALLVGVGGSGKQSLTRLAAYIARSQLFQITLTKSYGIGSLRDDLKTICTVAGHQRRSITFLLTDAEIKDEAFLEYVNSLLLTGEVAGLFAKDEMVAMSSELRASFIEARRGVPDTPDNLKQHFFDCVRENLHIVLCMSPVNPKFAERARRFPGLIAGTTVDWYLPWPEEALTAVSRGLLADFTVDGDDAVKEKLIGHMGAVHALVVATCDEYYAATGRHVYQTPKSFLAFLRDYRTLYASKLRAVQDKEARVNLGLSKLRKGAADVVKMKVVLAEEQVKLAKATEDTNAMLAGLQVSTAEAERESAAVAIIKAECQSEATRIQGERDSAQGDLAKAQPFVDEALAAINSIKASHITEVKAMKRPSDIIRMVFDGVLLLFNKGVTPAAPAEVNVNKRVFEFIAPSWAQATSLMGDTKFLTYVMEFPKDSINDETIELLLPYIDCPEFTSKVAKAASVAAEGLCTWVRSMVGYTGASKVIKPKLEALQVAEAQLAVATKNLHEAEQRQAAAEARMQELKASFDKKIAEKRAIEEGARHLRRTMEHAASLIHALEGEQRRWSEDSKAFADVKKRLLGDCCVASAFISYCGAFNAPFRQYLLNDKIGRAARQRGVPISADLDLTPFLSDAGTTGDWMLQGLPSDPLSLQNGILVTRSSRYPMLVDPQGQALHWVKVKAVKEGKLPLFGVTTLSAKDLREQLEFAMTEGLTLIVSGVDEELDPLLDSVLAKQYIKKGKTLLVAVGDKQVPVHPDFNLFFVTRLPNPHFSPELQAKVTVIDFTVTVKGLEEQLLGRVIAREQRALEDLLSAVLTEVNDNTKALLQLDALLLERLTSNQGNLLEDEELVDVLANTKAKAAEVKEKLTAADETRRSINEKREQFRPVATRGSVLYFSIVDMSRVNVMYQTSLAQFIDLFTHSMAIAEKSTIAAKRAASIIDSMTYIVYRYVNRGLYERDKLLFLFIVTVKVLVTAGAIDGSEVALFLRGGAALDIASVTRKKPSWMADDAWLNVMSLSEGHHVFKALPDSIARSDAGWRAYYNEPDTMPAPDYHGLFIENHATGPWLRLLLLRAMRTDLTLLGVRDFIAAMPQMGDRFTEPVTDTTETIYEAMTSAIPAIFLLSTGSDPTEAIEQLAKKKKQSVVSVSMGQGQEPVAMKAVNAAAVNGTWVLLQNCELGLGLMEQLEDAVHRMKDTAHPGFRLFISALPHPRFPLGLLQMSIKCTNEPPSGMQAGLLRSYTSIVDQDRLERLDSQQWRQLLYVLCFMHSVVQERRKFGPLGFTQAYEFNTSDLTACLLFVEKHLYSGAASWPTLQYMVAEVQYGGKITDNMDRRLFSTYAAAWLQASPLEDPAFTFTPDKMLAPPPALAAAAGAAGSKTSTASAPTSGFRYSVLDSGDIDAYRRYAASFPAVDPPELYGLHPNADLTFRNKEAAYLLETMGDLQQSSGAGGGSGSGAPSGTAVAAADTSGSDAGAASASCAAPAAAAPVSVEDAVLAKCKDLLAKLPADYVEDEYRAAIRDLGGLPVPLNMFLYQEVQRLQKVLAKVRATLVMLQQAIAGEVQMTSDLQETMLDLSAAKVPKAWLWSPSGDEFSWLSPTLGAWFAMLTDRDAQNRGWLRGGRPTSFWLAGFSNPQGFLTAMKQEVTRTKKGVALNDVVYHTEVTEFERPEQVRQAPKDGVYLHGIVIDGARWDPKGATLAESEPKRLLAPLPLLYVTAIPKTDPRAVHTGYEAPLYRYPMRTDKHLITVANLPTKTKKPAHWILRGVALLATA